MRIFCPHDGAACGSSWTKMIVWLAKWRPIGCIPSHDIIQIKSDSAYTWYMVPYIIVTLEECSCLWKLIPASDALKENWFGCGAGAFSKTQQSDTRICESTIASRLPGWGQLSKRHAIQTHDALEQLLVRRIDYLKSYSDIKIRPPHDHFKPKLKYSMGPLLRWGLVSNLSK